MIRLVALDIDFTLTNEKGIVTTDALAAIRRVQAKGVHIALVSARPPQGIARVADVLGGPVYCVAYFGAVICDPQGLELQRLLLDRQVALAVARFADERQISLTVNIDDVEYHTQGTERESWTPQQTTQDAMPLLSTGKTPVLMGAEGYAAARQLYTYSLTHFGTRVSIKRHIVPDGTYTSAHLVHPDAEKGRALATLCRWLGIPLEEVLAVGDNESDVGMLRVAGRGVAVGNATPDALAAAERVAPDPYGAGVAWALDQFILGSPS